MSTKSESNISTIWDIFKVEICLEAPGGKLTSKSRWEEGWKEGASFFSHFSEGNKKGWQLTFYSIFGREGGVCWLLWFKANFLLFHSKEYFYGLAFIENLFVTYGTFYKTSWEVFRTAVSLVQFTPYCPYWTIVMPCLKLS